MNVIELVSALGEAESFLVYAARVYRANREGTAAERQCLCPVFHAAGLLHALPDFVKFQTALAVDPHGATLASPRGRPQVSAGEQRLLAAFAFWQHETGARPEDALRFIPLPSIRRIAASSGRAFAFQMRAAGLVLPPPELLPAAPLLEERRAAARMH